MNLVPSSTEEPLQPVNFQNTAEAIKYCQEKLREGWLLQQSGKENSNQRLSHPQLNKERMFYQEGQSMSNLLVSGIAHLDTNLGTVRLDRYVALSQACLLSQQPEKIRQR